MTNTIDLGIANTKTIGLELAMANRHGLVAGAIGTGKTVSLQTLVRGFSLVPLWEGWGAEDKLYFVLAMVDDSWSPDQLFTSKKRRSYESIR